MDFAKEIMSLEPDIRGGSLRMFGCWFGKPRDNHHKSKSAEFVNDILKITFEDDETLEIWKPDKLVIEGRTLKILKATKVRWCWYCYGKSKIPENYLFYEYVMDDNSVIPSTNSQWPSRPSIYEPAVEIY